MPIIGLTTNQVPSFPEIGVLRKGAPKTEANRPGKDLEYFRFDTQDEDAAARFTDLYGPEPKEIRIFLPYPTADENFDAWREEYTASALKHRCDGETCAIWLKPDGTYSKQPVACPYLNEPDNKKGCKQTGRLQVIVDGLDRLAYVTVTTTSKHDIMELYANLQALQLGCGTLRGIPLLLTRVKRAISTPRPDGKRARVDKWLLHVEAQPEWVRLQLEASKRQAAGLLGAGRPLSLPAAPADILIQPDFEPEEIEGEIEGEIEPVEMASEEAIENVCAQFEALNGLGVNDESILARIKQDTGNELPALTADHLAQLTAAEIAAVSKYAAGKIIDLEAARKKGKSAA